MSSFKGLLLLKDSFIVFNLIRVVSRIVSLIFIVFGFTYFIYPDGYLLIIVSYHLKKVKKNSSLKKNYHPTSLKITD